MSMATNQHWNEYGKNGLGTTLRMNYEWSGMRVYGMKCEMVWEEALE